MPVKLRCLYCDKPFMSRTNAKYCCVSCKYADRRENFKFAHPEKKRIGKGTPRSGVKGVYFNVAHRRWFVYALIQGTWEFKTTFAENQLKEAIEFQKQIQGHVFEQTGKKYV